MPECIFFFEFCEISEYSFFHRTSPVAASEAKKDAVSLQTSP